MTEPPGRREYVAGPLEEPEDHASTRRSGLDRYVAASALSLDVMTSRESPGYAGAV
jgi:hypothetical protein